MAPRTGAANGQTRKRRAPSRDGTKPTLVLLVRHGQTPTTGSVLPGRAKGLHLADKGREQAARAGERIAALRKVAAVYASPLERTKETAAPIATATGNRVRVDRGLLECDFGDWTGKELKALMKLPEWKAVQRYPSGFRFPGGESFAEMQTRIVGALQGLVAAHPGETVVAVSHADPIKAAVAHALGTHLDLFQRIVVSPCSVTAVAYGPTGPVVLAVNSTGDDLSTLVPS
ncbi:MAG TPA: MSMEG_4193 family putative phosphomutase [Acidimicrobiales bacterium]|jgi:probable phosphoglycerate mutase|nr:MSMEG_4193 family putative phosphomutase [Acidimicrobiales bacterium]